MFSVRHAYQVDCGISAFNIESATFKTIPKKTTNIHAFHPIFTQRVQTHTRTRTHTHARTHAHTHTQGMRHLHNRNIIHGSLKSRNCVVDGRFVLKVTDYNFKNILLCQNLPLPVEKPEGQRSRPSMFSLHMGDGQDSLVQCCLPTILGPSPCC